MLVSTKLLNSSGTFADENKVTDNALCEEIVAKSFRSTKFI